MSSKVEHIPLITTGANVAAKTKQKLAAVRKVNLVHFAGHSVVIVLVVIALIANLPSDGEVVLMSVCTVATLMFYVIATPTFFGGNSTGKIWYVILGLLYLAVLTAAYAAVLLNVDELRYACVGVLAVFWIFQIGVLIKVDVTLGIMEKNNHQRWFIEAARALWPYGRQEQKNQTQKKSNSEKTNNPAKIRIRSRQKANPNSNDQNPITNLDRSNTN